MANQDLNNSRFTKEAAEWDANIKHVESTQKAFEAIQHYVPAFKDGKAKTLNVLEIGSGTGLLSYTIAPYIAHLIGVDTADGMIAAFNTKLESHSNPNLCALNHMLVDADSPELQAACKSLSIPPPYKFDLIVSHLTLHHIPSLPDVFATMYACLKPGGVVALTDYEDFGKEAIRFHPVAKRPGVERHGIVVKEAEEMLRGAGFKEVRVEVAFVLSKEVEAEEGMADLKGEEMEFPFLMCFGKRE